MADCEEEEEGDVMFLESAGPRALTDLNISPLLAI